MTACVAPCVGLALALAAVAVAAPTADPPRRAGVSIALAQESYGAGELATLRVSGAVGATRLQVFRVGAVKHTTKADDVMLGSPVSAAKQVGPLRADSTLFVQIGNWPSGFYFVRLENDRRLGFAPFVVRPPADGSHRVAVVMPTRTWQAYNFRDDDGDGRSDTWYAGSGTARLGRPFLNRGVPPHYRRYDVRFLNWLHDTGKHVDVLSQAELDGETRLELADSYDFVVFPGHHEYVTEQEYDAVTEFRDRGGNLAFLSANNFFWRIDLNGDEMARMSRWRRLGRPEAALLGVQYLANDRGQRQGPWLLRRAPATSWLFAGVDLQRGNEFSRGGVEIDHTTAASPRGTQVVAEIPNAVGPGLTAQMTYYETPAGARVFAAGAFTLAGRVYEQSVQQLLENLWRRLSRP